MEGSLQVHTAHMHAAEAEDTGRGGGEGGHSRGTWAGVPEARETSCARAGVVCPPRDTRDCARPAPFPVL